MTIRFRPDLSGVALRGGLGGVVGRGDLSAVLFGGVVPQHDQSAAEAAQGRTDRENILVQLRRERGLTDGGNYPPQPRRAQPAGAAIRPDHGLAPDPDHRCGSDCRFGGTMVWRGNMLEALGCAVQRYGAAVHGAALPAQPATEAVRRAISRRSRHHRAQPARRSSGADRDHHGGARNDGSDRQRVRHRGRRDHLRRRPRNRDAQPVFPHRLRTTCRCSSRRSRSRAPPAAISARSWPIFPPSSASASRCAARFARSPPKAAPRR